MKYVLDSHTHTIVSGHAYSTLHEMAREAAEKGLELLGVTEHSLTMPGTCHEYHFQNMRMIPRKLCGIQVMHPTKYPFTTTRFLSSAEIVELSRYLIEPIAVDAPSMVTFA